MCVCWWGSATHRVPLQRVKDPLLLLPWLGTKKGFMLFLLIVLKSEHPARQDGIIFKVELTNTRLSPRMVNRMLKKFEIMAEIL